jgi:hypothetical protein
VGGDRVLGRYLGVAARPDVQVRPVAPQGCGDEFAVAQLCLRRAGGGLPVGLGVELLRSTALPSASSAPILQFAILFGLSVHHEVLLLARIREDYLRTGGPRGSVVRGLSSIGRVITSAAAIVVVVFLGFATEGDVVVKAARPRHGRRHRPRRDTHPYVPRAGHDVAR